MSKKENSAMQAGTVSLGNEISVNRLGYGAMRLTGPGIWGPPKDRKTAVAVLRRAAELGVNFIDTADSYGPRLSEELIAEALHPYPSNRVGCQTARIPKKSDALRRAQSECPADLRGVQTYALGVDASGVSFGYWRALQEFWLEYFRQAGANVQDYSILRGVRKWTE